MYPLIYKRKFVGEDVHGNKYYEASDPSTAIHCRDRFVIFKSLTNYDASDIPAEWFGWLHKINDSPPSDSSKEHQLSRGYRGHAPNWTGTRGKYVPYSTTKQKVQAWAP